MIRETLDAILDRLKSERRRRQNVRDVEDAQFLLSTREDDTISLPVACAFLLCDLALIDGQFDASEYDFIFTRLEHVLGVEADEAQRIVTQAQSMLGAGRGAISSAQYIKEHFTPEQRQQVMDLVAGLVMADGKQDDYELYLQSRFAAALGLS